MLYDDVNQYPLSLAIAPLADLSLIRWGTSVACHPNTMIGSTSV